MTTSSDVYRSYYRDDDRLVTFQEVRLLPLSHVQQESLIRKRLSLMDSVGDVTDGLVDEVERRVNSAFAHKIVPRYPFCILAVIQTLEGFMPTSLSVTSYGHCYYVMVLARLTRSGISRRDRDINTCLNFAEHLALEVYEGTSSTDGVDFGAFVEKYRRTYLIEDSLLNRLLDAEYGLISEEGAFRVKYMFHYFLGMFLSKSRDNAEMRLQIIDDLCRNSHVSSNHLTLMFAIHHSTDDQVLNKIVERTAETLRSVEPAKLDKEETRRFQSLVAALPPSVLADENVESKRREERERRDLVETEEESYGDAGSSVDAVNDWYRILKNNRILGQILRNRCGDLKKEQIKDLIRTVASGGLRLVNSFLIDEKEISDLASFLAKSNDVSDLEEPRRLKEARKLVQMFSFVWTMINVESVVLAINFQEVNEIVEEVVESTDSPAYDLIGYFSALDSAERLTEETARKLKQLLAKHDDPFLRSVLSIRTQLYINTHRSGAKVEQTVCSILGIRYKQRIMGARRRTRR